MFLACPESTGSSWGGRLSQDWRGEGTVEVVWSGQCTTAAAVSDRASWESESPVPQVGAAADA